MIFFGNRIGNHTEYYCFQNTSKYAKISIILLILEKREIGLQLLHALLSTFLWIGVTLANLNNDEKLPVEKLELIIDINGDSTEFPNCLRICLGI